MGNKLEKPLAYLMAPEDLDEFIGQRHILGEGKPLRVLIEKGRLLSAIFYGPPGCGKTTLAKIIAKKINSPFVFLNASVDTSRELKEHLKKASFEYRRSGKKSVIFVDEIHRFNKLQQDVLLSYVERGEIIFLGSTVQNPFFAVNKALISRVYVFEFKPLEVDDLIILLKRAIDKYLSFKKIEEDALRKIAELSDGDARRALNTLELIYMCSDKLDMDIVKEVLGKKVLRYDAYGDEHYDMISAFIKSLRGGDGVAGLYWFFRMIEAGEDPRYILRRMYILAAEDIGLSNPNALLMVAAAHQAYEFVGLPEAELPIAEAILYLAKSPKSNKVLQIIHEVKNWIKNKTAYEVPQHLKDSHYKGAKILGHGKGYVYPHGKRNVKQDYLPKELKKEGKKS